MACDPQTLQTESQCIQAGLMGGQMQAAMTWLLCQINDAVSGATPPAPGTLTWTVTQFTVPNINPHALAPVANTMVREAVIFSVATNNAAGAKIGIVGGIVIPLIPGTFYEIKIPTGNYVYDLSDWFVIGNANDQFFVTSI